MMINKLLLIFLFSFITYNGAFAKSDLPPQYPVDIAKASGVDPVAVHGLWRAMSSTYNGPLFILKRSSDSTYQKIYPVGPGGKVNRETINSFCGGVFNTNGCTYAVICDQAHNTCSETNASVVTITNASPASVTWSGSAFAADTPIYFEYVGIKLGGDNLPAGMDPNIVYYVKDPVGDTFNFSATPGGAAINTTTAGTGTFVAYLTGTNDLYTIASTNTVPIIFSSLPTGENVPIFQTRANTVAQNRTNTNGVPTLTIPTSVYALVGTSVWGVCCATYGNAENRAINNGQGRLFSVGLVRSTGTGVACAGPVAAPTPCLSLDVENGIFASAESGTLTISNATPAVLTWTPGTYTPDSNFSENTPFWLSTTNTLPSPFAINTVYYARNISGNTFNASATPGGALINTTTAGAGTHTGNPHPNMGVTDGYVTALATCDGDIGHTLDQGTETSPILLSIIRKAPPNYNCRIHEGGLVLGAGGDNSAAPVAFFEGFVTRGKIEGPIRRQINQAIYDRLNLVSPPPGMAFDFVTSPSVPSGWTFSRANCTNQTNCVTDAQYLDAPGASYTRFTDNDPMFNSQGIGLFSERNNYIVNSDCLYSTGGCPVDQTSGSLSNAADYILFCNGEAGSSITTAAGTAVGSGFGTLACDSGTYQVIDITTTGTITFDMTGTIHWADLQDTDETQTSAPTPHIITSGTVPVLREDDVMQIGGTVESWMNAATFTAIIEAKVMTNTPRGSTSKNGFFLGGSATANHGMWYVQSDQQGGINSSGDGFFIGSGPTLNTVQRLGGALSVGTYYGAKDGFFVQTDGGSSGVVAAAGAGNRFFGSDTFRSSACNCWISKAAFYPYMLSKPKLVAKTTLGAALP